MSSNDSHQSDLGSSSTSKARNATITFKDACSENNSSKLQTNEAAEPETKKDGSPNMTFEAAEPETKKDGSPNMTFEGAEPEIKKNGSPNMTFEAPLQPANVSIYLSQSDLSDFDENLVLRPQCLASSTPMVSIKMYTLETRREPGHILAAQKKLYGKTPTEPSNTVKPSNIIGDRKTFFKQPTAKNLYPSSKIASELLKRNPSAAATGLLVKQQRPDGEAAKSSAAPQEQEKNSSSYNLRSLASKLPAPSGLQRPQVSGIPVGVSRATLNLRAAPCSSSEKPSGPAAANSFTKMAPGKRHPLAKGDVFPVSKRKKTDTSTTEAPVSVSDATSGVKTGKRPTAGHRSAPDKSSRTDAAAAKTAASYDVIGRGRGLKQPAANPRAKHVKTQSQGCTKCEHLSQEIERLKEVLRKHKIPLNG
ncbi:uncharacterized protein LOC122823566 isoform X2 [Gambusia affinis]|uniref:uncharacterized protein LOC122823566 isoform X2 n=1 Tax=Gambusia affinis TaxID=33528 RepID=UPI001CDD79D2|nr:uncharacterized protein LOC122823566 isoform X2 [Gambusia affinis]